MFKSYYIVKIYGKNINRFLKSMYKLEIRFINIIIDNNSLICKVDSNNYKKIKNIKTSYKIEVIKIYGINNIKNIIRSNILFIVFFAIGLLYLIFLSNIIFKVNIIHEDKEVREIINNELIKYNIKKYRFIKDYNYIQKIKNKIIDNNKDKIEWIEIERIGTTYNIKVSERIKNRNEIKSNNRHIVAKKSGIIKKIIAHDGEIIKKIDDYVNKGDIVISGEIHKGEYIKDSISAKGSVFAEVWYKVKVSMPLHYYEEKKTGNIMNTFKIIVLNKEYNLFNNNYKSKKSNNNSLFSDFYNLISFNYSKDEEISKKDEINIISNENDAIIIARDKIINQLDSNEYIISQKKLKTTINNSTINVEVFFKVFENISSYMYYN